MLDTQFNEIKTTYYYGGKTELNTAWQGYNVVCPTSKLYFVIGGEIVIKINGEEHLLKKGDCALIPRGLKHSFYLNKQQYGHKYWFHFDVSQGDDFFASLEFNYVTKIKEYDEMLSYFKSIGENVKKNNPVSKLIVSGAVSNVVALYLKNADVKRTDCVFDDIDKIIRQIQTSETNDFNLNTLAQSIHLSPNYFVRKFKEKTGFSPIKYMLFIKLEKAKTLLEETSNSIGEIMNAVGFYDSSYFSKLFKSHTGYSPTRYREIYGDKSHFKY